MRYRQFAFVTKPFRQWNKLGRGWGYLCEGAPQKYFDVPWEHDRLRLVFTKSKCEGGYRFKKVTRSDIEIVRSDLSIESVYMDWDELKHWPKQGWVRCESWKEDMSDV
jgi:hypothetical protein